MASNVTYNYMEFCGGKFWISDLTWNDRSPEFTQCFEQSILIWAPCLFLWLALIPYIIYLGRLPTTPDWSRSPLQRSKTTFAVFLCAVSIVNLIKGGIDAKIDVRPEVFVVSPAVLTISFIIVICLIEAERRKCLVTSGVLFVFHALLLLCGIPQFYMIILDPYTQGWFHDLFRTITFYLHYLLLIIQFILFCIADKIPQPIYILGKEPCPEGESSILSRLTFWWMNGLVYRGYKKGIEEREMWALNARDMTCTTSPLFEKVWKKALDDANRGYGPSNLRLGVSPDDNYKYKPIGDTSEKTPLLNNPQFDVDPQSSRNKDIKKKNASLFWALTKVYGGTLLQAHLCKLAYDILIFTGPLLQYLLIMYTESETAKAWKGYLYATLFFITCALSSIFFHQLFFIGMTLGMRIKATLIAAVYAKALTMSNDTRKKYSVTEIVNLMSVDAQRLQDVTGYLWMAWSAPLQIGIAVYFLWCLLGWSVFAGLGVMVLLIPVNAVIATCERRVQIGQIVQKEQRIKLINEILNGIKALKLYGWELSFKDKVDAIRQMEIKTLKQYSWLAAFGSFTWTCAPFMVTLATFAVYVLTGHHLEPTTAFVSLTLFNILKYPINLLPMMVSYFVTASVSIKRLSKFLQSEDIDFTNVKHNAKAEHAVTIDRATFAWASEELSILKNINLHIGDGSLVAVVGQVASGKSSLLSAMLGEMERQHGSVNVRGTVAYVPQEPWIEHASLRDNILFGRDMDEATYYEVLEACALHPDLEMLQSGDMTEIGDRVTSLSEEQKHRLSVARAVYREGDVYLIDEILSSLDSSVRRHIFDRVIGENGMLKDKTRIVVTNNVRWLPSMDKIIVMNNGEIAETGTFEELITHGGTFAQFLKAYLLQGESSSEEDDDEEAKSYRKELLERLNAVCGDQDTATDGGTSNMTSAGSAYSRRSRRRGTPFPSSRGTIIAPVKPGKRSTKASRKQLQEDRADQGSLKWGVFFSYIMSLGVCYALLWFLFFLLFQAASVLANVWLSVWAEDHVLDNEKLMNTTAYSNRMDLFLGVYGAFGVAQAIFVLCYAAVLAVSMIRASKRLHQNMLENILRAPILFFEATPIGKVLSRFSKDIDGRSFEVQKELKYIEIKINSEAIDNLLPRVIRSWMSAFFTVLSTVVVIGYVTPVFLALLVPLVIMYYVILTFYIPTSRQLKRIEGNTRAPIYAHLNETINGAAIIRSYHAQQRFIAVSDVKVDHNQVFNYAGMASNRWLGFWLEMLGAFIVFFAALFAVIWHTNLTGGMVGLSITYALMVTQTLNWMVRMTGDLETNILSVERVKEYSETPTEAAWQVEETRPNRSWPSDGRVAFEGYSARYRPNQDLVLKDLTAEIDGGEKVGIISASGTQKPPIAMAVFRLIEPAGGSIIVDGIHINTLGLHQLRSKITILPQDPVLWSGSIRMNVDPFYQHTDNEIWTVLEVAHLRELATSLPAKLDHECGEGGQLLSIGQRQLVCLARALLRKTKIVVYDEATSNIDLETDQLIQSTVRREFADCTVITVASRVNTIINCDRVMVLDRGKIVEFDSPQLLLMNDKSVFYNLAKDADLIKQNANVT